MLRSAFLCAVLVMLGVPLGTAPAASADADGWGATPTAPTAASHQPCASVLFIGVRGSGEPAPYGTTVTGLRDAFHQQVVQGKGAPTWLTSVRQVWIDYPATSPYALQDDLSDLLLAPTMPSTAYFDSVNKGVAQLTGVVRDSITRCHSEYLVMAGFSQGAQVITGTLAEVTLGDKLLAAVLMGNPALHPGQAAREVSGDAESNAMGLAALLYYLRAQGAGSGSSDRAARLHQELQAAVNLTQGQFDAAGFSQAMSAGGAAILPSAYARTFSICWRGDMVCDAAPGMTRVLTGTSTLSDEISSTRGHHLGYTGQVLDAPLQLTLQTAKQLPDHAPAAPGRRTPAKVLVAAGAAGGLVVGVLLGWAAARFTAAMRRWRISRRVSRRAGAAR